MKKKILSFLLVAFILVTFLVPMTVNAENKSILSRPESLLKCLPENLPEELKDIIKQDEIDIKNGKDKLIACIEVNEYDAIMNLEKKNTEILEAEGLSPKSIREIKDYDFHEILRELKSKNKSELKELGYSEERIDLIKAYDGSEASARAASANFTARIYLMEHDYYSSKNITRFRIRFIWEWSDVPFITQTDIIGACVSEGMYFEEGKSYNIIHLHNNQGTYIKGVEEGFRPASEIHCMESKFKMVRNFPSEYATEGVAYCSFTKTGRVPEVAMIVRYGHTTLSVEPSLSVGPGSFGFGFSPSWAVTNMNDKNYYIHSRNYGESIEIK